MAKTLFEIAALDAALSFSAASAEEISERQFKVIGT